jgi:hypothetical protein
MVTRKLHPTAPGVQMTTLKAENLVPATWVAATPQVTAGPGVAAQPAAVAGAVVPAETGDKSLPDPSAWARWWLFAGVLVAVGAAWLMNSVLDWTTKPWAPPKGDFNFSIFAAFYAAAQIIERGMELVAPLLPVDTSGLDGDAKVAQAKADRAKMTLAVASVAGVVVSNAFGLYFLATLGIHASHTVDSIATGLVIAAGTKPLHDFISLLQNQNNPETKSKAE